MSSLYEFYIEKEIRELTNTINSAKYISEEQKETMISVLEDADDDMKAAREKKKKEAERKRAADAKQRELDQHFRDQESGHAYSGGVPTGQAHHYR